VHAWHLWSSPDLATPLEREISQPVPLGSASQGAISAWLLSEVLQVGPRDDLKPLQVRPRDRGTAHDAAHWEQQVQVGRAEGHSPVSNCWGATVRLNCPPPTPPRARAPPPPPPPPPQDWTDSLRKRHVKFQQTHRGVSVEGAVMIVHLEPCTLNCGRSRQQVYLITGAREAVWACQPCARRTACSARRGHWQPMLHAPAPNNPAVAQAAT
jgi:hypothetical protein